MTTTTKLLEAVRKTAKYGHISQTLIRQLLERELQAGRRPKEAVKAVKNKLHQIAGAYFHGKVRYDDLLTDLQQAVQSGQPEALQTTCRRLMAVHASTRERLPILEQFYRTTLADLGPIRSVLDLACGFNPLTRPWLPLAPDGIYYACDIYRDLIEFLTAYFSLAGIQGRAWVCDVSSTVPEETVDLALVLKLLPVLDQVEKSAGLNLLRGLQANYMLVSFPVRSLGGRDKGMVENYEAKLRALVEAEGWPIKRFQFETELAFLISKGKRSAPPV